MEACIYLAMAIKRQKCDLCDSKDLNILYTKVRDYETFMNIDTCILKCNQCDLVQQSYIFTNDEIKEFYLENYHGRNYSPILLLGKLSHWLRKKYYKRFIDLLETRVKNKSVNILDYGSGDGLLSSELSKRGYNNLYCCDFFKPKHCRSSKYLLPNEIKAYSNHFDAVFMLNSIEHLVSFSNDFEFIDNAMKDESLIIIETPNIDSIDSHLFKKYWGGLHQPRHTFLWSKASLIKHLSLWNYQSENIGSPQSAHWAISIQNIITDKFKISRNIMRNGRMPGYVLIVILFLPFSILQNIIRKESVLNIISTKKKTKR